MSGTEDSSSRHSEGGHPQGKAQACVHSVPRESSPSQGQPYFTMASSLVLGKWERDGGETGRPAGGFQSQLPTVMWPWASHSLWVSACPQQDGWHVFLWLPTTDQVIVLLFLNRIIVGWAKWNGMIFNFFNLWNPQFSYGPTPNNTLQNNSGYTFLLAFCELGGTWNVTRVRLTHSLGDTCYCPGSSDEGTKVQRGYKSYTRSQNRIWT